MRGRYYRIILALIITSGLIGCSVAVKEVELNKTYTQILVGKSERIEATVFPSNADNKSIEWSSDNRQIAVVDSNGTIRALSEGTTSITAKASNGKSNSVLIVVTPSRKKVMLNTANVDQYFDIQVSKGKPIGMYLPIKFNISSKGNIDIEKDVSISFSVDVNTKYNHSMWPTTKSSLAFQTLRFDMLKFLGISSINETKQFFLNIPANSTVVSTNLNYYVSLVTGEISFEIVD